MSTRATDEGSRHKSLRGRCLKKVLGNFVVTLSAASGNVSWGSLGATPAGADKQYCERDHRDTQKFQTQEITPHYEPQRADTTSPRSPHQDTPQQKTFARELVLLWNAPGARELSS